MQIARLTVLACLVATALLAPVVVTPGAAHAHAILVRTDPEDGAKLPEQPERVTAWFSEPLEPAVSRLRVISASGEQVHEGETLFDPGDATKMSIGLRDIEAGSYRVTWETLSQVDGHFRFGSFEFTVLNPDGTEPAGSPTSAPLDVAGTPTGVLEGGATKWVQLTLAVVAVGGVTSVLLIGLPLASGSSDQTGARIRGACRRYLLALVIPAALLLILAGLFELWLQTRQFGGMDEVDRVLDTRWGSRWIWRHFYIGGLAAAVGLHLGLRSFSKAASLLSLWLALAFGLVSFVFTSLVSHANALPVGRFWSTTADFVHLSTAATWIGGLFALAVLLIWGARRLSGRERVPLLANALRRFSLLATTSLILLLTTGAFNTFAQIDSWRDLAETAYGRTFVLKLSLTVPLLAIAAVNAVLFRPRLIRKASDGDAEVDRLRGLLARAVAIEAVLGLAVLAAAGMLTQMTPARAAIQPAASAAERGAFGYPLAAGDWSWILTGAVATLSGLIWVWSGRLPPSFSIARAAARIASALSIVVIGAVLVSVWAEDRDDGAFDTAIALRYQASDSHLVLLEVAPFQLGENRFRVTLMTEAKEIVPADDVELRFYRLEREGTVGSISLAATSGQSREGEFRLDDTGWWEIEADPGRDGQVRFYIRLDDPSKAPLDFAPPDYESDPAAERLFRETLERFESLQSLSWREELSSGLLDPTGIGAWVLTTGRAKAPDRLSYQVFSPGSSDYRLIRVGGQSCFRQNGEPWECSERGTTETFELSYLERSTAFSFGRKEILNGEPAQVLLFNNPSQLGAWYAWWVSEDSGQLLRQVMVAPGHFMLTEFSNHNGPVTIHLPEATTTTSGG